MSKEDEITKNSKKKNQKEEKKKRIISIFKVVFIIVCIFIIVFILIFARDLESDKVVITIDGIKYTETDFNMYAYLVKNEYFGDNTEISEDTLNTLLSNDSNVTIGEYLKEKVMAKIKISAAILRIAKENNITLDSNDELEIAEEKNNFILELGGNSAYEDMLKNNFTNDEAFMEVARIEKLYTKIFETLYGSGGANDFTEEELETIYTDYQNSFVKIKQIILLKKDLNSDLEYDENILNQKETLANYLYEELKNGDILFDTVVLKYSEDNSDEVLSEYYELSDLEEEMYSVIVSLETNDISKVVSTDEAYHIILLEELDDGYLEEYKDKLRENKFISDINLYLDKIAIINSAYLEEICVK